MDREGEKLTAVSSDVAMWKREAGRGGTDKKERRKEEENGG